VKRGGGIGRVVFRDACQEILMHKFITHSKLKAAIVGAFLATAPLIAVAQDDLKSELKSVDRTPDSQVELRNDSRRSIRQLYFAPIDSERWGPNQVSHNSIHAGDSFTLTDIRCDKYDVKLVDEDGDECIVRNIALCGADKIWHLGDKDLLKCQAHTQQ
jgi:hypothetical protein